MLRKDFLLRGIYLQNHYLCVRLALHHSVSYFFSSINHVSCLYSWFLILFHLTYMRFSQYQFICQFFVFGDFDIDHKDWLPILVELNLVNSVIIFLSQMVLLRCLTFLLASLTVIFTVLHFLIYTSLLTLAFVLQWLSLNWEILIMLSQSPFTFCQSQKGLLLFIAQLKTILVVFRMFFVII